MKFYGKSESGTFTISGDFYEYLKSLEGQFEIKLTLVKDIRRARMNNLYWWWLGLLSEHSGYMKKELHNYFKQKLLCIEEQVSGETIFNCESTSELTIKQFSDYLQGVARLTAEHFDYYLPDQFP